MFDTFRLMLALVATLMNVFIPLRYHLYRESIKKGVFITTVSLAICIMYVSLYLHDTWNVLSLYCVNGLGYLIKYFLPALASIEFQTKFVVSFWDSSVIVAILTMVGILFLMGIASSFLLNLKNDSQDTFL